MKSKKLAVFLLTLVLTLGLFPMSVFAASTQRDVTADSTASITVENAVENDELAAYKVIDITYDSASNTLKYEWNSDFANYFSGTTLEQFDALEDDSAELKNLLAGLPAYIKANNIAPVGTQTVAAGTATFANLAMGEYFIRPTSSTSVYQLMLQKIEPANVDGTYKIDDVAFSAKKEEVTITKTADKTSVTKGEKVTYTVTVDIPTYAANTTDKSFYVSDLLADGLTLDTGSIEFKIDDTAVDAAAYTLDTTATAEYTFKLSVSTTQYTDNWSDKGGKQLVITYTATLNNDDTTEVNTKETNTATFDYSFYPYAADTHNQKTDTADVTTFAIKIDKFVEGTPANKLANAKFDLYRTLAAGETVPSGKTLVDIPQTNPTVQGILLESGLTTDSNGNVSFEKYEANSDRYDYYLVETQAPSGYNLLTEAVKVNFTDAEVEATAGVYTVKVPNKSGFILPITGGEGTVLFTVLGIAFMGGAVFLFVISRKKSKANSKK
ncbi:MAG: SpaH/EbpB family LPXTG-anchored major pilin [Oscillospiraceae bacterium]